MNSSTKINGNPDVVFLNRNDIGECFCREEAFGEKKL